MSEGSYRSERSMARWIGAMPALLVPLGCHDVPSAEGDPLPIEASLFPDGQGGFTDARTATVVFDTLIAIADGYSGKVFLLHRVDVVDQVGSVGRGPLEFIDVAALVPVRDVLVVFDRRQHRLTLLDYDLRPVGQVRTPEDGLFLSAFRLGESGVALVETAPRADFAVVWTTNVLALDSVQWRSRPLLSMLVQATSRIEPWDGSFFGGGVSGVLRVGWPRDEYLLYGVDLESGEPRVVAERDIPAPTLTKGEREAIRQRSQRMRDLVGHAPATAPERHPHFGQNVEDRCGRTWLLTYRGGADATIVDVFDAGGGFLSEVPLEARGVHIAGFLPDGTMVTLVRDELDRRGLALFDLPAGIRC